MARWAYAFRRERAGVHKNVELADRNHRVEQSVQKLAQQEAVDRIHHLPDVWKWVLHFGGDCSKKVFFVVNSNVATNDLNVYFTSTLTFVKI